MLILHRKQPDLYPVSENDAAGGFGNVHSDTDEGNAGCLAALDRIYDADGAEVHHVIVCKGQHRVFDVALYKVQRFGAAAMRKALFLRDAARRHGAFKVYDVVVVCAEKALYTVAEQRIVAAAVRKVSAEGKVSGKAYRKACAVVSIHFAAPPARAL